MYLKFKRMYDIIIETFDINLLEVLGAEKLHKKHIIRTTQRTHH